MKISSVVTLIAGILVTQTNAHCDASKGRVLVNGNCVKAPTMKPTQLPTWSPSKSPTHRPTRSPTKKPSYYPSKSPTMKPTPRPTRKPTDRPSKVPTCSPTPKPTKKPTKAPTSLCGKPLDVSFVLDKSGSIGNSDVARVEQFVRLIAQDANIGLGPLQTRMGITFFSTQAKNMLSIGSSQAGNQSVVINVIKKLRGSRGWTNMRKALSIVRQDELPQVRGLPVESVVVLITDGRPQLRRSGVSSEKPRVENEMNLLKAQHPDTHVVTVGVGKRSHEFFLKRLATSDGADGKLSFYLDEDLTEIFKKIANVVCNNT